MLEHLFFSPLLMRCCELSGFRELLYLLICVCWFVLVFKIAKLVVSRREIKISLPERELCPQFPQSIF